MNGGILGFVTFGAGAAISAAVLRALREGSQPDPRAAVKEGVRVWMTIANAAGAAQAEFDAFQAEVRADADKSPGRVEARRRITLEPPA